MISGSTVAAGEDKTPVFTILAAVWLLVAVAELDVAAQRRG